MKILIKTSAIHNGLAYNPNAIYEVGKNINEDLANKFVLTGIAEMLSVLNECCTNNLPKFTGTGNTTINKGSSFNPLNGVTATDKEDGDITDSILYHGTVNTSKDGDYWLKYFVSDSQSMATIVTRKITVVTPNTPPMITIETPHVIVPFGGSFNAMAGVTAIDAEDGLITGDIVVGGDQVNVSASGLYTVTFSVTDSGGLKANGQKTVEVEDEIVRAKEEEAPTTIALEIESPKKTTRKKKVDIVE